MPSNNDINLIADGIFLFGVVLGFELGVAVGYFITYFFRDTADKYVDKLHRRIHNAKNI